MSAASRELSEPTNSLKKKGDSQPNQSTSTVVIVKQTQDEHRECWRDIVQKRIDNKTRRFVKGRTKPLSDQVANQFAPVAGYFIFPLLQFFDRFVCSQSEMIKSDLFLLALWCGHRIASLPLPRYVVRGD